MSNISIPNATIQLLAIEKRAAEVGKNVMLFVITAVETDGLVYLKKAFIDVEGSEEPEKGFSVTQFVNFSSLVVRRMPNWDPKKDTKNAPIGPIIEHEDETTPYPEWVQKFIDDVASSTISAQRKQHCVNFINRCCLNAPNNSTDLLHLMRIVTNAYLNYANLITQARLSKAGMDQSVMTAKLGNRADIRVGFNSCRKKMGSDIIRRNYQESYDREGETGPETVKLDKPSIQLKFQMSNPKTFETKMSKGFQYLYEAKNREIVIQNPPLEDGFRPWKLIPIKSTAEEIKLPDFAAPISMTGGNMHKFITRDSVLYKGSFTIDIKFYGNGSSCNFNLWGFGILRCDSSGFNDADPSLTNDYVEDNLTTSLQVLSTGEGSTSTFPADFNDD